MRIDRRQFLKAFGQVAATYACATVVGHAYGKHVEPKRSVVEQVPVPLKNLKSALEGFKIVQLSDIHIDSFVETEVVQEAAAIADSLKPDLIVLTGDYVTGQAEAIRDLSPILASLNAKYGVFAILGNHELWTNPDLIRDSLEKAGVPVLVNEGVPLNVGKEILYLAGVDDCWSGQPDLEAAMEKWPSGAPTILLAHEPDFVDTFALDGRVSLQLSGHSHGGQIRLPGLGAVILPEYAQKYDQGLYRVNPTGRSDVGPWVYTNRGVGLGVVPYRINCPPEVTEITLFKP